MHYFCINISKITPKVESYIKSNYPKRYARALKYINHDDYLRCLGAYYLLDKALGKFDENLIKYSEKGKPSLDGYPYFNYSHSGNLVVLIVDKIHEVGIDVQFYGKRNKKEVIEWTKKEAVWKLTGEGISLHKEAPLTYKNKKIKVIKKRITSRYAISIAYI